MTINFDNNGINRPSIWIFKIGIKYIMSKHVQFRVYFQLLSVLSGRYWCQRKGTEKIKKTQK